MPTVWLSPSLINSRSVLVSETVPSACSSASSASAATRTSTVVVVVDDAVTVKALALTPVPAVVVTLSLPVVAPLGTVACIWVSESTVTRVAGVPFKATWVAPGTKFVPVRVTAVPTGPLVGVNELIVGGNPVTVKALALSTEPAGVVTLILPLVAPPGTLVLIWVSVPPFKLAGVPFKATWVAPVKFVPVMVTPVPTGPLVGVNDVIVGGGVPDPPFTMVK